MRRVAVGGAVLALLTLTACSSGRPLAPPPPPPPPPSADVIPIPWEGDQPIPEGIQPIPEEIDQKAPGRITARVCGWNIKKLGFDNKPPRPARDYALMAQIIEGNCDVVGVLEVMNKPKPGAPPQPPAGYDALSGALGAGWGRDKTTNPAPGNTGVNDEFYAFFWRKSLVRQCAGWGVRAYPDAGGNFKRDPGLSCFEIPDRQNPGMDFLLALYHAPKPASNPAVELVGIPALITWMQGQKPGEGDLFIVGDFNLVPADLETELAKHRQPAGTFKAGELGNVFAQSPQGTTINVSGDVTANHYDHFIIVFPTLTTEKRGQNIIDGRTAVPASAQNNTAAKRNVYFEQAVSDHLMTQVVFDVTGPDDD